MPGVEGGWGVSGWGGNLTSAGGTGGGTATVQNYQPAAGTPITPSTPLDFDVVSSNATLISVVVEVFYPETGASEIAYGRDGFTVNYAPTQGFVGSSRVVNAPGNIHFTIRRRGGWYRSPQVKVTGADSNGNAIAQ